MRAAAANRVRIIGGEWRSRLIEFPDSEGLRPTPDRVRETLFNWLGQDLTGQRCLDLFAGSGALGFEALSRGAREVVMVERSRVIHQSLRRAAERLGAGARLRLAQSDALEFLRSASGRYDVVFVDPPYASGMREQVLPHLPNVLAPDGVVYVEDAVALAPASPWRVLKSARAGAVHYNLLQWGAHDQGSVSGDV